MTDTASLVARVKTDGVTEFNKQLDTMTTSAGRADKAVNDLIPDLNRTNTAAGKTASDGFAKFRNSAGQVGYQVQDLVVQLQSGQSAFVAIGQQGSQLAGAFGPGGAVLGAVIALASAVGGVLYNSMGTAKISAQDLEKATKSLNDILKESADGTMVLTDEILKLASANQPLAQAKIAAALADAQTKIDAAGQSASDAVGKFDTFWSSIYSANIGKAAGELQLFSESGKSSADALAALSDRTTAGIQGLGNLYNYVDNLQSGLGLTKEQAFGLVTSLDAVSRTKSPEAVQSLASNVAVLAQQNGTANTALNEFNAVLQTASAQGLQGAQMLDLLKKRYADLGAQVDIFNAKQKQAGDNFVAALEAQSKRGAEAIRAQAALQKQQIEQSDKLDADQKARALAAIQKNTELELKELSDRENKKAEKVDAAASRKEEAQAKRDERELQRQQKQADDFLAQVERQNGDELAQIDATEKQKLAKLDEYHNQHLISDTEFESARTAIQLTAEDQRQKEIDKRREEAARKQGKHDQYIAEIQGLNATELEMIDAQEKAKEAKAKEYRDRGIISEQEYATAIEEIHKQSEKKKSDVYIGALGDMTSNLKTALGENNALYKAAAITQTIIETYKGAQAAFSALAPIPIVGPALGTAAAAAAIGAGMARIAAIRSAREQGGTLSAGQYSTIAERNKPEVIMPAGASRVRTAEQMRQIMGESSGNSSSANNGVIIVNNTSARIDTATTERDDEGRLRVIIRELVSSDLQDSNSSISKSRRATRGMAGF